MVINEKRNIGVTLSIAQSMVKNQRAGQILWNATSGQDIFYWSDEKLEKAIFDYIQRVTEQSKTPNV